MASIRAIEIKLVGAFFLVTGLVGFFMITTVIFPLNDLVSILNIFPACLFALTFYSGYLLLLKENPKGLEIARAILALQIIQFNIAGVSYFFVTGIYILVGFANLDFGTSFGFQNIFHVNISESTDIIAVRVNVLAIGAFFYISKVARKLVYDDNSKSTEGNHEM